ncbi:(1-_4)-alpha-D-glucan synthase (UDP-glucose) [Haloactinopolyspora alba]|uniref:(1->4)-alpha-D-glucan synthase (UDP-glucose) n=1 Tax=Haloactinopolyspora alba TaxID=648780 RepID=A0A2P8E9I1_9ACTN|nr:glycosyltransferase family 4 protein [Haloactinopolyspora alba]PSL06104.1 (1->4)-alpha-D-glucan synthase (UDP-glucose) [Haloactinopolyspora alba]
MRILVVSWEYPPVIYGGLGRHVQRLTEGLVSDGHDVSVVTQTHPDAPDEEDVHGVRVLRVRPDPPAGPERPTDLVPWVLALNTSLIRAAHHLTREWLPDVVHAHDWVDAHAGINLARALDRPLVATVHATEAGLWDGWLSTPLSRARHDIEAWMVAEAGRTIVCSEAMRVEASAAFDVPPDDLTVILNAVDQPAWSTPPRAREQMRERFGIPPTTPMLVFGGRLEWEKGADICIEALAQVRQRHHDARLVLAGAGSQEVELRRLAQRLQIDHVVQFAGRLDQSDLAALFGTADVALVPSSYEPFGIVALEAGAAGTPVIAGDSGGLREVVEHDVTGLLVPPRDTMDLAAAVLRVLDEPGLSDRLVQAAHQRTAKDFVWSVVARETEKVYASAITEPRPPRPRPAPAVDGNVLADRPESVRQAWRRARGDL